MPEAGRKDSDSTLWAIPGDGTFTMVTGMTANVRIGGEFAVCKGDMYACTGVIPSGSACATGKVTQGSATSPLKV